MGRKNIDPKLTDRKKLEKIYNFILDEFEYRKLPEDQFELNLKTNCTSKSLFETKKGSCDGMSAAMRELAAEAGIQPEDKLAFSKDGKNFHVWNIVYPDGKKYNIDVSQDALWKNNSKNEEFFLVGDEHFVEYFNRDTDIYGK